ncbi:MAG: hypothetical protein RL260_3988 [Pseudomonadota bacterium]|jgi:antitoxin StbD
MWQLTKIVLADTNESALSEAKLEELADQELYQKVLARMADKPNAIEVDLDDL